MSAIAAAAIGSAIIGGVVSGDASKKASDAQVQASQLTVAEQRAARDELRTLLAPYTAAGTPALQAQMNLLGIAPQATDWNAYAQSNPELLAAYNAQGGGQRINIMGREIVIPGGNKPPLEQFAQQWHSTRGGDLSRFQTGGAQGQRQAISQFEASPMFQALARQGEDAILQNASATGGLRGGNVQGALAQFRPALLNQQIQQQFQNLGSLSAIGQSSATGTGVGGQKAANEIGQANMQAGNAQAAGYINQSNAITGAVSQIGGYLGGRNVFGGGNNLPTVGQSTQIALDSLRVNPIETIRAF